MNSHSPPEPGSHSRILIADDDPGFRDSLAAWLRAHGRYETVCTGNAEQTLDHLKSSRFDALISDIRMPGNTGLELLEKVRQTANGLPIFLLTGQPTIETAIRSVSLPVTAYFTKPPELARLVALLDESIVRYRHVLHLRSDRDALRDWEADLGRLIETLDVRLENDSLHLNEYLRVSLRSLLRQLAGLEKAVAVWSRLAEPSAKRQMDVVGALQQAVTVLRQTKQDFKSTKLADLRRNLEALLVR